MLVDFVYVRATLRCAENPVTNVVTHLRSLSHTSTISNAVCVCREKVGVRSQDNFEEGSEGTGSVKSVSGKLNRSRHSLSPNCQPLLLMNV